MSRVCDDFFRCETIMARMQSDPMDFQSPFSSLRERRLLGLATLLVSLFIGYGIFGASIGLASPACPQRLDEEERREANGIMEAGLASVLAWEKGDVLIRVIETVDTLDRAQEGEEASAKAVVIWHRFVFDHLAEKYFYIRRVEAREEFFAIGGGDTREPLQYDDFVSLWISGEQKADRQYPNNSARWNDAKSPGEVLVRYKVPDLRGAMLGEWSGGQFYRNKVAAESMVRSAMAHLKEIRFTADGCVQLVHLLPSMADSDFERQIVATWDCQRFVFLGADSTGFGNENGQRNEGKMGSSRLEWKELNGNVVPIRVVENGPSLEKIGDRKVAVLKTRTVDAHWFSINEDLKEELFDAAMLESLPKLTEMIDPVSSGADSLIDIDAFREDSDAADK